MGMHRSGTSVTANLIHELGYFVPEHLLLRGDQYNAKGYWEDIRVIDANNLLLQIYGGDWKRPIIAKDTSHNWLLNKNTRLLQRHMTAVARPYVRNPSWMLKDPRFSVTLPYWIDVLPNPRVVICTRNPIAVAKSLEKRNEMALPQALDLWFHYMSSAINYSKGLPSLLVHYENYFNEHQRAQIARIADFVGRPTTMLSQRLPIEQTLQHHLASGDMVIGNPDVPLHVQQLYAALLKSPDTPFIDALTIPPSAQPLVQSSQAKWWWQLSKKVLSDKAKT